jgi:hypothetical protein
MSTPQAHFRARAALVRRAATVLLAVLVVSAGYLAWTAMQARSHLERAREEVLAVQSLLSGSDVTGAQARLQRVQTHTRLARRVTSGPTWRLAGAVPFVGRSARSASGIAAATDDIAREVLPPVLDSAHGLTEAATGPGHDVDVQALARVAPPLHNAAHEATRVREAVAALPDSLVLGPVARARTELLAELDERLVPQLQTIADTADVVPRMLGMQRPRRYFVALQNTAEARGTGGLFGVYAVLVADRGAVRLERVGDANELLPYQGPRVDLGPEHAARYGVYGQASPWLSANLSPHFPYAGRTWSQLWERHTGQPVDGVVAVDPAALDHVLSALGPVALPNGTTLWAGQAVALTQEQAYVRYPDLIVRKQFLSGIVEAVFGHLTRGQFQRRPLLAALAAAVREGRVKVYSVHDDEQQVLEGLSVGSVLPLTPRPFVLASVNNAFGNKLDYYLDRRVDYHLGVCARGSRASRVSVRLSNTAPPGLVDYVTGHVEARRRGRVYPEAHHRVLLSVFTTAGAKLRAATLDGQRTTVRSSSERGHPVFDLYIDLPRGAERVLVLDLVEPAVDHEPLVVQQPLVRPQTGTTSAAACRRG